MSMQEFVVGPDERMCLAMLRGKHRELGFNGPCVVKFAPCHFLAVRRDAHILYLGGLTFELTGDLRRAAFGLGFF